MYLLKIKGAGKLPDYVQIRDENFKLIAFINLASLSRGLKKHKLEAYQQSIENQLKQSDFNEVIHIEE